MSELPQLAPFVTSLRQLRTLQGQYTSASRNPQRREELKPLMREARTIADANGELLRAELEITTEGDTLYAAQLFILWRKVKEAHTAAYRDKYQSQFEKLRKLESDLDKMLRQYGKPKPSTKSNA